VWLFLSFLAFSLWFSVVFCIQVVKASEHLNSKGQFLDSMIRYSSVILFSTLKFHQFIIWLYRFDFIIPAVLPMAYV
jgi:hypothetical protein